MTRIPRPTLRTVGIAALPLAAVAITVPTMATAIESTPATVFKGCLFDGEISRVTTGSAPTCTGMGDGLFPDGVGTAISWNEQGVPGTNGTNGTNGKDAYEVAKANGFQGTALEWLTSLRGLPGAKGVTGANGKNGVSGYTMLATRAKAAPRTAATYTVKCKDGKVALGGGMNGTSDLLLNGSGPTADARGWIVRVTNVAQKARTVNVYVTCAVAR
jgi:hypothetical protein